MRASKYADIICENCGTVFKRRIKAIKNEQQFCSLGCYHASMKIYTGGTAIAYYDGHKINTRKFQNQYHLKKILDEWKDIYAGGEVSVQFNEICSSAEPGRITGIQNTSLSTSIPMVTRSS